MGKRSAFAAVLFAAGGAVFAAPASLPSGAVRPVAAVAPPPAVVPLVSDALRAELKEATPEEQLDILVRRIGEGDEITGSDLRERVWFLREGVVVHNPVGGTTLHGLRPPIDLSEKNVPVGPMRGRTAAGRWLLLVGPKER